MLSRPCDTSSGSVDGPTHTLESTGGGNLVESTCKQLITDSLQKIVSTVNKIRTSKKQCISILKQLNLATNSSSYCWRVQHITIKVKKFYRVVPTDGIECFTNSSGTI